MFYVNDVHVLWKTAKIYKKVKVVTHKCIHQRLRCGEIFVPMLEACLTQPILLMKSHTKIPEALEQRIQIGKRWATLQLA